MVNQFFLPLPTIIFIQNGHDLSNHSDASKGDSQNKGTAPTVNNKPSTTLMGLSDPIIKRKRVKRKNKKNAIPLLFDLLSALERAVERGGLSIHLAHNTQTV